MGPLSEITPMLEQEKVCTHNNIPMKLDHDAHHPNEISTEKSCPISTHSNSEQSQLVTIQDQSDNPVVHCDQPVSNETNSTKDSEHSLDVDVPVVRKRGRPRKTSTATASTKKPKTDVKKRKKKIAQMAKELNEFDPFLKKNFGKSESACQKSKPPFIQIQGPSKNDAISVSVINSILDEDTNIQRQLRIKYHDDAYVPEILKSDKNAVSLWICVFCKRGPHSVVYFNNNNTYSPGDLFGPNYVMIEDTKQLSDPFDLLFKSSSMQTSLKTTLVSKISEATKSTADKSIDNGDCYYGFKKVDHNKYEVWFHEDCMVWAPNVYMIDTKIYGLEQTVIDSIAVSCSRCGLNGANLCCFRRGCLKCIHYRCAVLSNWQLNSHNFVLFCPDHVSS